MNDDEQNFDVNDEQNLAKKDDAVELIHNVKSTNDIKQREDVSSIFILQKALDLNENRKQHSR